MKKAKFKIGDQVQDKSTGQIMEITEVHGIFNMDTNISFFSGQYTCSFVKCRDDRNTIGYYKEDDLEEITK